MKYPAVILAAGEGRRLRKAGREPKPLHRLLGLTLIERAILSCREIGINEFYVVVGYEKEKVIRHVEEIGNKYGVKVNIIENLEWKKGNGLSLFVALLHVKKPFFLLMCDHVFDIEIFKEFKERVKGKYCYLAVDENIDKVIDLKEATKVKIKGNDIVSIGKEIKDYNAVDMGLFFCQPYIFSAIKKAIEKGDSSLTGGIKELVKEGKIKAIKFDGKFWIDVDTPENMEMAKKYLLASLIKEEDGYISYHINRKISTRISEKLSYFDISPNTITVISFLIATFASFLFTFGKIFYTILAGILIQLSSIIDGCDGEIARLKFKTTPYGAWFDTILDRYADLLIVAGISYGYWLSHRTSFALILALFSIAGFILSSYSTKEYILRFKKKFNENFLYRIAKRDTRLFVIFIGSLFNLAFEFMVATAILHHISIIWNFIRKS